MAPQPANPLANILPILAIMAIFYLLLIRPQKKQEQERKKMLSQVSKNDEVVTSGGIHGTVVNTKDRTLILRIDDNVKIEIERSAVAYVKNKPATSEGK